MCAHLVKDLLMFATAAEWSKRFVLQVVILFKKDITCNIWTIHTTVLFHLIRIHKMNQLTPCCSCFSAAIRYFLNDVFKHTYIGEMYIVIFTRLLIELHWFWVLPSFLPQFCHPHLSTCHLLTLVRCGEVRCPGATFRIHWCCSVADPSPRPPCKATEMTDFSLGT